MSFDFENYVCHTIRGSHFPLCTHPGCDQALQLMGVKQGVYGFKHVAFNVDTGAVINLPAVDREHEGNPRRKVTQYPTDDAEAPEHLLVVQFPCSHPGCSFLVTPCAGQSGVYRHLIPAGTDVTYFDHNAQPRHTQSSWITPEQIVDLPIKAPEEVHMTGHERDVAVARMHADAGLVAKDGEVRMTDPDTGAQKGSKDARYDLIPVGPLKELAELYGVGAKKYAERNWELGYKYSLSYAALQRHANQFWSGENVDDETKKSHLASVVFHAFALMQFLETHPDKDDRASAGGEVKLEEEDFTDPEGTTIEEALLALTKEYCEKDSVLVEGTWERVLDFFGVDLAYSAYPKSKMPTEEELELATKIGWYKTEEGGTFVPSDWFKLAFSDATLAVVRRLSAEAMGPLKASVFHYDPQDKTPVTLFDVKADGTVKEKKLNTEATYGFKPKDKVVVSEVTAIYVSSHVAQEAQALLENELSIQTYAEQGVEMKFKKFSKLRKKLGLTLRPRSAHSRLQFTNIHVDPVALGKTSAALQDQIRYTNQYGQGL